MLKSVDALRRDSRASRGACGRRPELTAEVHGTVPGLALCPGRVVRCVMDNALSLQVADLLKLTKASRKPAAEQQRSVAPSLTPRPVIAGGRARPVPGPHRTSAELAINFVREVPGVVFAHAWNDLAQALTVLERVHIVIQNDHAGQGGAGLFPGVPALLRTGAGVVMTVPPVGRRDAA